MRNDEQLLRDEIESTQAELYETAVRLYEAIGMSAVQEWGYKIGLRTAWCKPCEATTPTLGDPMGEVCAVCGTTRK